MKYKLQDLIDMELFQNLQDRLNEIYSFPSSIIDNDGNILTATAWQDICIRFHRKNEKTLPLCIESDKYILSHLHEANPAVSYRCPHGLIDNATPIIIEGVHYGNFFTGQFFLEKPDLDFFRAQAASYGFDEKEYLEAVQKVPVWNREQLNSYLFFIKGLIAVISESGLKRLREIESRKAVQSSMERHQAILKTAMDGFWLADPAGRLREVNEAYCRMSGYTEPELLGMRIKDLEVVEDPEMVAAHMKQIVEQGSDRFESRHRRKDGSIFHVEISTVHRPEDGGGFVTFIRDITDRKQAEDALLNSKIELEQILKAIPDAIIHVDRQRRIMRVNPAVSRIFGYRPEEVMGRTTKFLYAHGEEFEELGKKRFTPEAKEYSDPYVIEYRRKNGEIFPGETTATLVRDTQGRVIGYLGLIRDITDQKKAEKEKKKLEAQLLHAQKMESIGRLAGGVAHDFNNMLSVIQGNTEMILEDLPPDSPHAVNVKDIRNASQRSAELTRQLLGFARRQTIAPKVLDLNETVEGMLKMIRRLIGENIDLEWRPSRMAVWPVKMDPSQVDQILANLCVNAKDAIHGVGRVVIETANATMDERACRSLPDCTPGEYVKITVSDNGCGMDERTMSSLFEPFFTTKEVGLGTGLGLATVYGIVKQNDGCIDVRSEPAKGTAFRIYLPRVAAYEDPAENSESAAAAARAENETILVVEDEAAMLDMTALMLKRLGYTVLTAPGPSEALRVCRSHAGRVDLVITDVIMPEMNGKDLVASLRKDRPDLASLYMSGYSSDIIAPHGILDDGVAFINKPFSRHEIARKIRGVLGR